MSSTKIRKALLAGDVSKVFNYLGYHYQLEGTVVKGKEIGRTIDFPTANLGSIDSTKLIPKDGVYAVKISYEGKEFDGMMNIGTRPTIDEQQEKTIEVNIFDFNQNIYQKNIRVYFKARIRDEKKFNSPEELVSQLNMDKDQALKIVK